VSGSVLVALRPGGGRAVGALLGGLLAGCLGWLVGADAARTVVGALAVGALALLVRTSEPTETRWPDPPSRRTRPGWHVVAGTQRALESARTDPHDRRSLERRLDLLAPGGPDPRLDAARAAVGLPGRRTRRPR